MTDLPRRFRAQAEQCALHGSPLTAALLHGAADDYDGKGPAYPLLLPLAKDPSGSVPSLRFAGALHRLVLERQAPELALHYPSVGGTASPEDVWPAARKVVEQQAAVLAAHLHRPVQTNEVGRAAVLFGGLLHVAAQAQKPLRLLEIGASAGLNLNVDRFAYDIADGVLLGAPDSPVRLYRPWQGAFPPHSGGIDIQSRRGCDPAPLDPTNDADRLTLTSYVWPDQVERFERLRGALAVAARQPQPVDRMTAAGFLTRELSEPAAGVATVVWHSVVRQYLTRDERDAVDGLLAAAGRRASESAPLFRLSLEPEKGGHGAFGFRVELTSWPSGDRRTLAECRGHGPPVVWS